MQKIKTLDQITFDTYGINTFRSLPTVEKTVVVKIQRNNIEIAKLELKELKNKRG